MNASVAMPGDLSRGARLLRIFIGLAAVVALSPIIGMLLVFAVIPALLVAIPVGIVLGPMNWLEEQEDTAEVRYGHHRWLEVPA
ncbi:MAG TPA: hypothetical protein VGI39_10445 [Polyangiaceae bacterium]|jgi:hypothetical protein